MRTSTVQCIMHDAMNDAETGGTKVGVGPESGLEWKAGAGTKSKNWNQVLISICHTLHSVAPFIFTVFTINYIQHVIAYTQRRSLWFDLDF